jgi:hypothetical protein
MRLSTDATELAGRVEAQAAGGYSAGAQDEEEREAGGRELVEGLVDLLLGRLPVEVTHGKFVAPRPSVSGEIHPGVDDLLDDQLNDGGDRDRDQRADDPK